MIGDWVNVMKKDSYEPVRVCTIYENAIDYLYIDNSLSTETTALGMITIAGVEPILITPEILEKNGFGYTEESEYYIHYYLGKKNSCKIGLHIGTDKMGNYWLNTIRDTIYGLNEVHQLQHALRMCGIEKEIII